MHKESKRKRKFYISTLLAKVVVIKIYPTPFLKQSNWLKKRRYTVTKMKPGYEKNTVIIGCFFPSRYRQIYIAKKIELHHDVDKTATGGNFVFLEDKFEIPDGESMNKRFFRLK